MRQNRYVMLEESLTGAHISQAILVDKILFAIPEVSQKILELSSNLPLHRLLDNEVPDSTPWVVQIHPD